MRSLKHQVWVAALALLAVVLVVSQAAGQSFPFDKGDVIRLVVPYNPGGGFDRIARIIQPFFAEALAKLSGGMEMAVIVENRAGAGGRVGYEYVYNSAPDGTRMVVLGDQGAGLQQIGLKAKFDLEKFTYFAQVNNSEWGILIRSNTGMNNMNDLIKRANEKPILVGTSGAGSGDHIASIIVQAILARHNVKYPLQFVHFKGASPVFASMQRDEAELYIGSVESTLPAVKEGYAKIIVVFAERRSPFFPNVSTAAEQGIPGASELAASLGITRVLVGPPGIPEPRVKVLREALKMALTDPKLLAAAEKAELPVDYGDAAHAIRSVRGHTKGLAEFEDAVIKAIGGK